MGLRGAGGPPAVQRPGSHPSPIRGRAGRATVGGLGDISAQTFGRSFKTSAGLGEFFQRLCNFGLAKEGGEDFGRAANRYD